MRDYFKRLFCFHSKIKWEFHVKEENYKKFDKVDVKQVCTDCGHSKYLRSADICTIHIWSSDPKGLQERLNNG